MHPYESIRTEMLRRINDQSWPAGFTLPREEDLAEGGGAVHVHRAVAGQELLPGPGPC